MSDIMTFSHHGGLARWQLLVQETKLKPQEVKCLVQDLTKTSRQGWERKNPGTEWAGHLEKDLPMNLAPWRDLSHMVELM